jgi:DNA-binding NarL/FixJ family response regulator
MIIDEQPFFRAGVHLTLESQQDFEIMDAEPSEDLLDVVDNFQPDIVLLGADLASFSGLELGTRIARRYPNTKVIMLSPRLPANERNGNKKQGVLPSQGRHDVSATA